MKVLRVFFHGFHTPEPMPLGRLVYRRGVASFEFAAEFLGRDIDISPFKLPLQSGLIQGDPGILDGLHGLFHDSLPDGWGLLLMDRALQSVGVDPGMLSPIDRLAFVGSRGMGALSYQPDEGWKEHFSADSDFELGKAGVEATQIFEGALADVIDYHTIHGTPSGGARPKLLVGIDTEGNAVAGSNNLPHGYEHWIVKFPTGSTLEKKAEGALEYVYARMAVAAGIDMATARLISTGDGNAYFASRRFDREAGDIRNHIHSVAGLLSTSFREPNYDYLRLLKLTLRLTRSVAEQREVFQRMLFNVIAGNRDDHTKNFAFLMRPNGEWVNTPAYDITFNQGMAGEHNMTIAGKGRDIVLDNILSVAEHASLTRSDVLKMLEQIACGVSLFEELARDYGIPDGLKRQVADYIDKRLSALSKG